jgi:putative transposase
MTKSCLGGVAQGFVGAVHGMATEGYDFVEDRTHDGRKIRVSNIVAEFTREALAIRVARRLNSHDVIDVLSDLFILRGVPAHIRSDNGPEFIAQAVQAWITAVGAQTVYVTPGALEWQRREALGKRPHRKLQCPPAGRIRQWRDLLHPAGGQGSDRSLAAQYNTVRPHSPLGYRPPVPEVFVWPPPPAALKGAALATAKPAQPPLQLTVVGMDHHSGACHSWRVQFGDCTCESMVEM